MAPVRRIASLKSPAAFREHAASLGIDIPCADVLETGSRSPLAAPLESPRINGRILANRIAIHPMEGWDGTGDGRPTPDVERRWRRFGRSGAKLIYGGEAMAVAPEGRANPRQLILSQGNLHALSSLRRALVEEHRNRFGSSSDPVVGFQLTHSGRFSRPGDRKAPRIAFRHPLLDRRTGIDSDSPVLSDAEVEDLIGKYVEAARVAAEAGADFVDIKHCHGYLLHEFLAARTRPGPYGGSFANRTRILREIVAGIRALGLPLDLAVRLSAFDMVPFRPDPASSSPGRPGPGIPEDYRSHLPYRYGFGLDPGDPLRPDLSEPLRFVRLCHELGVRLVNVSAGSPYYNPHIQRPAAFPPSDGYLPARDPLVDVARQLDAARRVRRAAPPGMALVGSGYSYLQEYLPHVAQETVGRGWIDIVGLGRAALSYPGILADALEGRPIQRRLVCRTFSDCTTAPRSGMASGCYPLDPHYARRPEAARLKALKKGAAPREGEASPGPGAAGG